MHNRSKAAGSAVLVVMFVAAGLAGAAGLGWRQTQSRGPNVQASPGAFGFQTNVVRLAAASPVETPPDEVSVVASNVTSQPRPATGTNSPTTKSMAVLEAQIALDRLAISPGSIDGSLGSQTRAALQAFQQHRGIPVTGELDAATQTRLIPSCAALTSRNVKHSDLERLLPLAPTWLGKSEQTRLDYETILELFAESAHAHPKLIQRLNPGVNWALAVPGTMISLPAVERARPEAKAAFVRIRLSDRTLQAFDSTNRLLAHFPCSIAARVDKRPFGELTVTVVVPNPDYLFNPDNFPESAEARELGSKLRLNPGPNNPVGTAWIGLNLPGYGIHGTPKPEDVGRTESHGCFRLANWNAEHLLQLVSVGTPVRIEP